MEQSQKVIEYSLDAHWDSAVVVRERTAATLQEQGYDAEVVEAATMCITELTENAVKYGNNAEDGTKINASITRRGDNLVISVSNKIAPNQKINALQKTLNALNNAQNPGELHIQRMREIMKSPKKGSSRLGIYRIAYEGEFKLDCKLEDGVLTVEATREVAVAG